MKAVRTILTAITIVAIPFLLLMIAIRLVMTPLFLQAEYRMPGFPEDPYGFTLQDRLYYSRFAVDYLFNDADISYLGDLTFPDGSPLYNERELSHMVDVKNLVQVTMRALGMLILTLVLFGVIAWRAGWLSDFFMALSWGGWATIGVVVTILIFVAISFRQLFTAFHRVFFEGDTWLFSMSDSLIRLLPLRLWQDGFIAVGLLTVILALMFGIFGRKLAYRLAR